MASLAGFADAKRSTPVASAQKTATTTPSPQRSSAPLAGFAPAAKPLSGFAPAKPVATGFAAPKSIRARTGAAAIPPGRDGGVVPRGPRLSDKWVSGGSARKVVLKPVKASRDVCDDCGWRDCQCVHRKVVRVVRAPLPAGAACRGCFCGEEDEPLWQPCACRGESAYAHASCLRKWAEMATVSTAASYECPTCKTRYTGPTAVALAVDRVDLEYDRSGPDSRHADVACANLVVVGLREGTTIDAALLRRQLRKDTRRDRLDSVLASIKKCEQKRDKAIEATKASLLDVDEGALRKKCDAPASTAAEQLSRADSRLELAFVLAERCVRRLNDHTRSRDEDRKLQVAASEALSLAQAAHGDVKRILGPNHDDTRRHLRCVGRLHALDKHLREANAQRAKRENLAERLARVDC